MDEEGDLAETLVRVEADKVVCRGFQGFRTGWLMVNPPRHQGADPTRSPFIPSDPIR
jgi:hypothetical protein